MLSFTTGSNEAMFSSNGINGDMNVTLWPLQVQYTGVPGPPAITKSCHWSSVWAFAGLTTCSTLTLVPLQNGILYYCGFQVLAPQIFWAPPHIPSDARDTMLEGWRKRLQGLLSETPLTFAPADSFDTGSGFQLKKEVKEQQAKAPFGLTVGHHMGKPLPPNNQIKAGV